MTQDLFILRNNQEIQVNELAQALQEVQKANPEFQFDKRSDKAYELTFLDAEVGSVDLADQKIVVSSSIALFPFGAVASLKIAEKLNATIFDPHHGKDVDFSALRIEIEALKARHNELFGGKEKRMLWTSNKKAIDFAILRATVSEILSKYLPNVQIKMTTEEMANFITKIEKDGKNVLLITSYRKLGPRELTEQPVTITLFDRSLEQHLQYLADTLSERLQVTFTRQERY